MILSEEAPSWSTEMPHPVRKTAQGHPAFTMSIMFWSDDVSGNQSKQYNPHTNIYWANLNLPREKLQQEYFVRFCSTSPHASAFEQLEILKKETGKDQWYTAYVCLLEQEIIFQVVSWIKPAHNPQQSQLCSHIGGGGNMKCCECLVGGSTEDLETDNGYESLFSASNDSAYV